MRLRGVSLADLFCLVALRISAEFLFSFLHRSLSFDHILCSTTSTDDWFGLYELYESLMKSMSRKYPDLALAYEPLENWMRCADLSASKGIVTSYVSLIWDLLLATNIFCTRVTQAFSNRPFPRPRQLSSFLGGKQDRTPTRGRYEGGGNLDVTPPLQYSKATFIDLSRAKLLWRCVNCSWMKMTGKLRVSYSVDIPQKARDESLCNYISVVTYIFVQPE